MLAKIEEFFFGKVMGRVIARLAVSLAGYLAGHGLAIGINVDPGQIEAALITGFNALYSMLKDFRDKRAAAASKPAS